MDDDVKFMFGMAAVIIIIFGGIIGIVGIATYFNNKQNDEYCRTISMERMDKERCGL